ncbi:MAG TPA: fructose bisphosphate aldolase [Acidimicrobiales bacterium]|nr:fructose bisphosphate aldolase [Acidimicrobiales bacterium]
MNQQQFDKVGQGRGFIAALDQSGGSTPKALRLYGVDESQYSNDTEMFDRIHEMRSRIITSPAFTGERVLGAILFEQTMDRQIEGQDTGDYLWGVKGVVPFIKIDKGLADESDGVQIMKPMPGLDELLDRSVKKGMFGTKERSFIKLANRDGIAAIVDQQFDVGRQVLSKGLVPILEPEVDIHSPDKAKAEALLKEALLAGLDALGDQHVMLKLTLPSEDNFYAELVDHPKVLKVVALSGGYTRDEACAILARNRGVIASFSRALTEGLTAQQSDDEFNRVLDASIEEIFQASVR